MDTERFAVLNDKFDDYYLFLRNRKLPPPGFTKENEGKEIPYIKFDIGVAVTALARRGSWDDDWLGKLGYKLVDIKMLYGFLRTTEDYFYLGPTVIVGNNEFQKLNPATLSLLRGDHYRVYLVAALTEALLDFMHMLFKGKQAAYQKGKWQKLIKALEPAGIDDLLPPDARQRLLGFKEKYRTAELHKFSCVRGFISKAEWDHFQQEERDLEAALGRLHEHMVAWPTTSCEDA